MDLKTFSALASKLGPHVPLGKSRLQTLCLLIVGVVSARTVNLSHVACERAGPVRIASTYRRLQRFFQHVRLPQDWAATLIARLTGHGGPWTLCLDRTNWMIGQSAVNVLVLALATRRHRIPLLWTQLGRKGNSHTTDRIALIERFIALFGKDRIALLLADREFVGQEWFNWLIQQDIPFVIRVPESLIAEVDGDGERPLWSVFRRRNAPSRLTLTLLARPNGCGLRLTLEARRLKAAKRRGRELLIVATNRPGIKALSAYRKRWAIESLFGDTKTRGLNIEDTRLTNPDKLNLLMAVVALAAAWASRTAALITGNRPFKRKSHGYYAKSWFRTGFDHIRHLLRSHPPDAFGAWQNINIKARVV